MVVLPKQDHRSKQLAVHFKNSGYGIGRVAGNTTTRAGFGVCLSTTDDLFQVVGVQTGNSFLS